MFFFFLWGIQTSHLLYFAFPAPAHFLDFLHFTLLLLQNIKHCWILSPYFSHFPPYWNFHLPLFPLPPPTLLFSCAPNTGKNNGFPFLDIFGYLKKYTHKIPNLAKWDKSQPGNSQPSSQIGTCLTLPNLGFLWVFKKYPKMGCSPALFKCTPRGSLNELETMEKTSQ